MRTMMNKTKEELLNELREHCWVNVELPHYIQGGQLANDFKSSIENAVREAILESCNRIVNAIYTAEDMERDLEL